jgi:hypothetical protein
MNSDSNLAAWMIAGGSLASTAAIERDRDHRRTLAAAPRTPASLSLAAARISAAFAAFRAPRVEAQPACCPA